MKTAALMLACALPLAGCASYSAATTSDQVLARQYGAHGVHGVMTGTEAQVVTDNYRKNIGTHVADQPSVEPAATQQ